LAKKLHQNGVNRVNISMDSLIPERFEKITRGGDITEVIKGIDAAIQAGMLMCCSSASIPTKPMGMVSIKRTSIPLVMAKSTILKQELPVAAMFVIGSKLNEQSL
jgi:hypothetical protein